MVLLTRLRTLLTQILLLLYRVLILDLTVFLKKWLRHIGQLGSTCVVLVTQLCRRLVLQVTTTLWLFSMQSGCISSGQLTRVVMVLVLLNEAVRFVGGHTTFSPLSRVVKCLWLLVKLTVLGPAFTTPMLSLLSTCVNPSGARLLSAIMMLLGCLMLTMLTMLLQASGLKHRWLDALQLAEMALGP